MAFPNIPNITPLISVTTEQTIPLLLSSIALEELALAHILNAEAEKMQFILGTLNSGVSLTPAEVSVADLLNVNSSVQRTLRDVIKKEMLLEFKFENILDLIATLPTPPSCQTIRISGFTSPRNRAPLVDPNGNPTEGELGGSNIVNALLDPDNFSCENGIVRCDIQLLPFVNEIAPGSLVDAQGNRKVDVFFAGLTEITLSAAEANELAAFVSSGGILYISGNSGANEGPSYNPLFTTLGLTDTFTNQFDNGNFVESSNPLPTPVTTGPFGNIGPLLHTIYRVFIPGTGLDGVATGLSNPSFILSEGAIGSGYISVTGDPLYFNFFTGPDPDNLNYFLNLFALACKE